ncbi:hypothetical protein ACG3JJ_02370 [Streptococcus parauberis]|uniref:hypothetical protein n=1 Tax=Streptococcus parauberis TaxID=1348 RepID=UPI00031B948A|nr:hypothetical protein [Streptococcus parauberis]QBX09805.1 hypothetical protein JavanS388_0016 [Streptococcus satellite phage Javan388]QBX10038.1 hypothetical protein JavanS404_0017 [Streptococcus satellite phage Javan404]UWM91124.1 hypothetical protein N2A94_00425 [Streptococcus parauberis]WEM63228.1 hypothetical protein P1T44_09815 [Streptococcus parauberis]GAJ61923.1 thioredoxin [Streptococcus parauberis]
MQELNLTPSQTAIFFVVSAVILLVMILSKQTIDFVQDFNKACEDNEKASADLIKANEELRQTIIASRQGAYLQIEHH